MALPDPLPIATLADMLPIQSVKWQLQRFDQISGMGSGDVLAAQLAPPRIRGTVVLAPMHHDQAAQVQGVIESLDGAIRSFYLYAPQKAYPAADPGGAVISGLNLLRWSEAFDQSIWLKTGANVAVNAAVAPDGSMAADRLVEDSTNGNHGIQQAVNGNLASTDYIFSVFLKAGERTRAQVSIANLANQAIQSTAMVDLLSGTMISGDPSRTRIEPAPYGWWRVSSSVRTIGSVVQLSPIVRAAVGTSVTYQGDGVSGLYLWGGQHEVGNSPSPYSGRADAAGALSPVIASVGANNKSLTLGGLPPSYVLTSGDYLAFDYGSSPTRRAFLRAVESAAAAGSGVTPPFEVRPHLPSGVSAGIVVTLVKPAAKVFIVPETFDPGTARAGITEGMQFEVMQRP